MIGNNNFNSCAYVDDIIRFSATAAGLGIVLIRVNAMPKHGALSLVAVNLNAPLSLVTININA